MADNVTLNSGTGGATLATDDVTDAGGAHYQRVKLTDGTANSETHINAGNGTAANALRVTVASDSTGVLSVDDNGGSLTVDGTVTANLSATDNAVLDNIVANTVNLQNCIVQDDAPFTPATGYLMMIGGEYDDSATDSVDEGDAGSLRISANRNMYTQIRDAAGNERGVNVNASNQMEVNIGGQSADITIADGGNSITVDGTVTANLSATDNAVLDNIDTQTSPSTSHYRNIDANAEAAIKGSAGTLNWVHAMNMTAAVAYLHLYDATTAAVTPGTTTPDYTFPIPTQGDTNGAGFMASFPNGIAFANAITLVVTTTLDGSAGDPGTNGVIVNASYT